MKSEHNGFMLVPRERTWADGRFPLPGDYRSVCLVPWSYRGTYISALHYGV